MSAFPLCGSTLLPPKHDPASRWTKASWLCLLLSHDVSTVQQPDVSAWPGPGLPQAPLLDKRPAIRAHFKDTSQSKTAFMHLFWQSRVHAPFFASSPFRLRCSYPSSTFPNDPQVCLDEQCKTNKCEWSFDWHSSLLTQFTEISPWADFSSPKFGCGGCQQRWREECTSCAQTGRL